MKKPLRSMIKLLKLTDKFESGKHKDKTVSVVINKGEGDYLNYFLSRNKEYRLSKDVINLAQSKTQLKMNGRFIEVLHSIGSPTSKKLLKLNDRKRLKTIFTSIKALDKKPDLVKFNTPFGNKNNEIKVGRLVKKIFELNNVDFTDGEIEKFVSEYTSVIQNGNLIGVTFEIVDGERIRELYHYSQYHEQRGTLGKSCMKNGGNRRLFDLYTENPDYVKMLVLFDNQTNKVTGRALIWQKCILEHNGSLVWEGKFMDRIYVNDNKHIELFKNYARSNKISFKAEQKFRTAHKMIINGKRLDNCNGKVEMGHITDNKPFLDTFRQIGNNCLNVSDYI